VTPSARFVNITLMEARAAFAVSLYAEEVARARAMDPGDRLLEGARLFDRACRLMADGIRHERPDLDDHGVHGLIRSRLARLDAIERQ